MNKGKVWLVGAGPGDAGLMTLKGSEAVKNADVIVYDSLVGDAILSRIPQNVELINVGKRANHHTMSQYQINEVLLQEAKKGKRVVRLKGGDPFLFGRGGEELELLCENDIPFEIIPGITSPIAVPAYNGIPVTHRDYCSSIHIVTGHKRAGEKYDIAFSSLVDSKGTIVFLMGISSLPFLMKGLLDAGMDPKMPAAVLQQGTTAGQKRVVATVASLEEEVKRQGIETPAIIVVGKVCTLADQFHWYDQFPLSGSKVIVTRPEHHQSKTAELLREKGAEVLEIPSIATVEINDNEEFQTALQQIGTYAWIVFTSPTGVDIFFEKLFREEKDIRVLSNTKFAVIGEGSRKKLKEYGILADFMPTVYDGDTLGKELAQIISAGDRILIPRAEKGNEMLVTCLTEAGAQVHDLKTYRTEYRESRIIDEKKKFENKEIAAAVFTSASTVKGFVHATEGLDYRLVTAACIGRQTEAAAKSYGMKTYVAEKATIESLVDLVCEIRKKED